MHTELKTYKNKNIGQFTSIPLKLSVDAVSDANLDSLYLATHFHKLRTQTVAHVRKSKHYATTLAAWQKKLKGVDVSDLAAVSKTLGLNVEVFNPLASASSESHKTLFSGGGRSKRKAQLLKVKKGVYKPMKAGAIIDDPRLPPDVMSDVVGRLEPRDRSSLLDVSEEIREDTLAAMPPQERLWHASRLSISKHVKTALKEGARVNKIDPSVGMNALKMVEGRDGLLGEFIEKQGGKSLTSEQINDDLIRSIKAVTRLDPYDPDIENKKGELRGKIRETLLDGADPNAKATYYSFDRKMEGSLLHVLTATVIEQDLAVVDITVDTIKELKSFGIDMNKVDYYVDEPDFQFGETALHYACYVAERDRAELPAKVGIRPAIVRTLLECGINVNAQCTRMGHTALHRLVSYPSISHSLRQEDVTVAELLLSFGADVSIYEKRYEDEEGLGVDGYMDYLYENGPLDGGPHNLDLRDVLMMATETRKDFIEAVDNGKVESVKQFLRQGVPVNTLEETEDIADLLPVLYHAIYNFYFSDEDIPEDDAMAILRLLLDHPRIDINVVDEDGETAIMSLLSDSSSSMLSYPGDPGEHPWRVDVVRMLIAKGIDLNKRNKQGKDVWDILMTVGRHENEEIIRLVAEAKGIPYENRGNTRSRVESEYDSNRNVRQRVGGAGNTGVDVDLDLNADSRGTSYSEDDTKLAKAIEVLFRKMSNVSMKNELRTKLLRLS